MSDARIDEICQEIHPATAAILQHFKYEHLPPKLQAVSMPISELAKSIVQRSANGPELTVGLRKLLEAKDCFVRHANIT